MTYTMSKDGILRKNVRITVRLSQDQIQDLQVRLRIHGDKSGWRKWLAYELYKAVDYVSEYLPMTHIRCSDCHSKFP